MKNSLLIYLLLNISLLYIVAAILTEVRPSAHHTEAQGSVPSPISYAWD